MPFSVPDWPPVGSVVDGWTVTGEVHIKPGDWWWSIALQCNACGQIRPDHWARVRPHRCACTDPYPVGTVANRCEILAREVNKHTFRCQDCDTVFSLRCPEAAYVYPNIVCPSCSDRRNPFHDIFKCVISFASPAA